MKDRYTIIRNPSRWYFKFEVWVSGPVAYVDAFGNVINTTQTKCFKLCRTEMQAELEIQYQKDVAEFKGCMA